MTTEKKPQGKHKDPAVLLRLPELLLEDFDYCCAEQSYTRSELLRELMRRHVVAQAAKRSVSTMDFNTNASQ